MARIGVIGATGWLGSALVTNLLAAKTLPEGSLVLLNRSGPTDRFAPQGIVTWASDATDLCARCDTLVLSVRPGDFPVEGFTPGRHLILSFMAAWPLADLARLAPQARIARAMPNGGATVGQSFTPWVAGSGVTENDVGTITNLLSAMGSCARVGTEAHLDYLSALSGSGAAYPALMARVMLADAARRGLPPDVACMAVESVICGSASLLAGQLGSIPALLDSYMSYRGITAAGLDAATAAGFETSIAAALDAAFAKAQSMKPR